MDAVRYNEAIYIGSKRYFFSWHHLMKRARNLKNDHRFYTLPEPKNDRQQRIAYFDTESFGSLLAISYQIAEKQLFSTQVPSNEQDRELQQPCRLIGTFEDL